MPFSSLQQAEAAVSAAKAFYLETLERHLLRSSYAQLSRDLGIAESTLKSVHYRAKFGPLRKLAKDLDKL